MSVICRPVSAVLAAFLCVEEDLGFLTVDLC